MREDFWSICGLRSQFVKHQFKHRHLHLLRLHNNLPLCRTKPGVEQFSTNKNTAAHNLHFAPTGETIMIHIKGGVHLSKQAPLNDCQRSFGQSVAFDHNLSNIIPGKGMSTYSASARSPSCRTTPGEEQFPKFPKTKIQLHTICILRNHTGRPY